MTGYRRLDSGAWTAAVLEPVLSAASPEPAHAVHQRTQIVGSHRPRTAEVARHPQMKVVTRDPATLAQQPHQDALESLAAPHVNTGCNALPLSPPLSGPRPETARLAPHSDQKMSDVGSCAAWQNCTLRLTSRTLAISALSGQVEMYCLAYRSAKPVRKLAPPLDNRRTPAKLAFARRDQPAEVSCCLRLRKQCECCSIFPRPRLTTGKATEARGFCREREKALRQIQAQLPFANSIIIKWVDTSLACQLCGERSNMMCLRGANS